MLLADDNTLWIAMTKCTNGVRANSPANLPLRLRLPDHGQRQQPHQPHRHPAGALSGRRDGYCRGHRPAQDLHGEGGQVYIYSTVDGTSIDNQYVTVTGVASDVAYMDGLSDSNNTVY